VTSVPRPRTGLRWAIYLRVSTRKQSLSVGDDPTDKVSLDEQDRYCRDLVERLDPTGTIDPRHVYRDTHTGIDLFTRGDMTRLRDTIRRRDVDAVACYHPFRWTRDPDHWGYLRTELVAAGVAVRFAEDDPGDGDAGEILGYLRAWSGKQDHKRITSNTHNARRALVKRGSAWPGCKPPYGLSWSYRSDRRPGGRVEQVRIGWEENPVEAGIVRELFGLSLAGATLRGMAADLTARGVPSPKGQAGWTHATVKRILLSSLYAGEAYSLRHRRDKESPYTDAQGQTRYRDVLLPPDEWTRLPDGYAPALVDREAFDAVQQIVAGARRGGSQPADPTVSLMRHGRARCASCGRALVVKIRRRVVKPDRPGKPGPKPRADGATLVLLVCSGESGWNRCPAPVALVAERLDAAVKKLARLIYEHPDVLAEQAELHRESDPTAGDLATVERTLGEIERQQASLALVAAQITSTDAAAPLVASLEVLAERKKQAEADRTELKRRRAGWEQSRRYLETFAEQAATVAARLDGFGYAEWQDAVDALGLQATVYPSAAPAPGGRYTLRVAYDGALTGRLLAALGVRGELPALMDTTSPSSTPASRSR
jgi:DNA invertase Pin-like site-specific DNA recombinase